MFYIYDVDMTLVESDCQMTEEMSNAFRKAMEGKTYFFCSGSALPKMKEQISTDIIKNAAGLLPVMGGELWKNGELIYQRKFEWPEGLERELEKTLANSAYPERTGEHIQDRITMLAFSTVGKAADMPARKRYMAWETEHKEREAFAKVLAKKYPSLQFSIGGQTSIDISEHGNDKSQALTALRKYYGSEAITFFGDRIYKGGNDYPLSEALKIENNLENVIISVKNPEDTLAVLQEMVIKAKAS